MSEKKEPIEKVSAIEMEGQRLRPGEVGFVPFPGFLLQDSRHDLVLDTKEEIVRKLRAFTESLNKNGLALGEVYEVPVKADIPSSGGKIYKVPFAFVTKKG